MKQIQFSMIVGAFVVAVAVMGFNAMASAESKCCKGCGCSGGSGDKLVANEGACASMTIAFNTPDKCSAPPKGDECGSGEGGGKDDLVKSETVEIAFNTPDKCSAPPKGDECGSGEGGGKDDFVASETVEIAFNAPEKCSAPPKGDECGSGEDGGKGKGGEGVCSAATETAEAHVSETSTPARRTGSAYNASFSWPFASA